MKVPLSRQLAISSVILLFTSLSYLTFIQIDKPDNTHYPSIQAIAISNKQSESAQEREYKLLVVVPGTGDATRIPTLQKSLLTFKDSQQSTEINYDFQCVIYVYNWTLLDQIKHDIHYCDIQYNVGLWTDHMSKVQLFDGTTHVAILMDDFDISSIDTVNFLNIMKKSKFDVASAALPQWHYPAMHTRDLCLSHQTNFADVTFTIFAANAWLCWQNHINLDINHYGWGYDVTFNKLCNVSIGIIDDHATAVHMSDSRSYNTIPAMNQLWTWIQFVFESNDHVVLSLESAKNYWKYVNFERPLTFPMCTLYRKIQFVLGDDEYYNTAKHRGGWREVIKFLINSQILINPLPPTLRDKNRRLNKKHRKDSVFSMVNTYDNISQKIMLVDCFEQWIFGEWGEINVPWLGITHFAYHPPDHIESKQHLKKLLEHPSFLHSLKYNVGIFVLAKDVKQALKNDNMNNIYNINVCNGLHPITIESSASKYDPKIDLNATFANGVNGHGIALLGQQYRRLSTIHRLWNITNGSKYWMPGLEFKDQKNRLEKYLQNELQTENITRDENVEIKYIYASEEFDMFVKQNLVIVDVWAATANNAVLEAIALNAPFFIRKLDSTMEYIGNDYPLFFQTFNELRSMLILQENELKSLLLKAHFYLKKMDKSHLTLDQFAESLLNCVATSNVTPMYSKHQIGNKSELITVKSLNSLQQKYMNNYFEIVENIEGWFSYEIIIPILLTIDTIQKSGDGNILEIGVYHGKSFIPMACLLKNNETAVAVDVFENEKYDYDGSGVGNFTAFNININKVFNNTDLYSKINIIKADATIVKPKDYLAYAQNNLKYRIISIDARHTQGATINDLKKTIKIVSQNGVIIMDDYLNDEWPGVKKGLDAFLGTHTDYRVFFMNGNKFILCHKNNYETYINAFGNMPNNIAIQHELNSWNAGVWKK
eukprot:106858_1